MLDGIQAARLVGWPGENSFDQLIPADCPTPGILSAR